MVYGEKISATIHKQTCRVHSVSGVHKTTAGDLSSGAQGR